MQFSDARKYKKQIKRLYRTAFPANERAPLFLLFRRTDNGRDSFWAVVDEEKFVGLVYTISTAKMVYVFFLAVEVFDERFYSSVEVKFLLCARAFIR